jgi:hypothetical protein
MSDMGIRVGQGIAPHEVLQVCAALGQRLGAARAVHVCTTADRVIFRVLL